MKKETIITLSTKDIKRIIAEKFGKEEDNVELSYYESAPGATPIYSAKVTIEKDDNYSPQKPQIITKSLPFNPNEIATVPLNNDPTKDPKKFLPESPYIITCSIGEGVTKDNE